jgi:hypothetical protein
VKKPTHNLTVYKYHNSDWNIGESGIKRHKPTNKSMCCYYAIVCCCELVLTKYPLGSFHSLKAFKIVIIIHILFNKKCLKNTKYKIELNMTLNATFTNISVISWHTSLCEGWLFVCWYSDIENTLHVESMTKITPSQKCCWLKGYHFPVGFTTTYAISAYNHWCCEFESRSGRGIQHYVIKFVSDLWQVDRSMVFSGSFTNKTDHQYFSYIVAYILMWGVIVRLLIFWYRKYTTCWTHD